MRGVVATVVAVGFVVAVALVGWFGTHSGGGGEPRTEPVKSDVVVREPSSSSSSVAASEASQNASDQVAENDVELEPYDDPEKDGKTIEAKEFDAEAYLKAHPPEGLEDATFDSMATTHLSNGGWQVEGWATTRSGAQRWFSVEFDTWGNVVHADAIGEA